MKHHGLSFSLLGTVRQTRGDGALNIKGGVWGGREVIHAVVPRKVVAFGNRKKQKALWFLPLPYALDAGVATEVEETGICVVVHCCY